MGRITAAWVLGTVWVIVMAAPAVSLARQDRDDAAASRPPRAYKPAQRRVEEEDAAQAAQRTAPTSPAKDDSAVPANVTDPVAYQKELDAAKEQRDRDLKEAAKETDRRKFQKRQEEIMAQYASILAAMRDKYDASKSDDADPAQPTTRRPGKTSRPVGARADRYTTPERMSTAARKRSVTRDDDAIAQPDTEAPAPRSGKSAKAARKRGGDDSGDTLEEAQKRLDDENSRHDSVMEQLNKDLADAQASKNKREIRKAERAIEKENTTYETKKSLLESRVKELGGKLETAPPARPAR